MADLFLLVLSTFTLVAALPKLEIKHLAAGAIELSLDDVPGMKRTDVEYSFSTKSHQGTFHQAPDGRWYHVNTKAGYYDKDPIKYRLFAEFDKTTVESTGQILPVEKGLVLTPPRRVRRGIVVFRDDFNGAFDTSGWDYEVSMYGGYNWEVQVYVPDKRNIFTKNGHLFIKPTLTTKDPRFKGDYLTKGRMNMTELFGSCTNSDNFGCYREGRYGLLPPIMSGKIKSKKAIRFGSVEVRARTPRGDWLWPAIWMLPTDNTYGNWPASGEIDIMESRGNLVAGDNHGVSEVKAALHWGPDVNQNRYTTTQGTLQGNWSTGMHTYRLDWTQDLIQIFVDDRPILTVPITESFWQRGGFSGNNIWGSGTKAAPFDTPFYLMLNVAVAGVNHYFPDDWTYNTPKPWKNTTPTIAKDFLNGINNWLPTWECKHVAMEIDYVQMTEY